MGLGPLELVPLANARERALAARRLLLDGIDPIEHRRAERATVDPPPTGLTFRQCAEQMLAAHEDSWKNEKHRAQWRSTLETYAYPVFGDVQVSAVDKAHVLRVLEPIWREKAETASRLRGRIERVLDWATARDFRTGDNPARWRGHLDKLLPAVSKARRVKHHAALPYRDVPAFLVELRDRDGLSARALEFLILTASRTGEVLGAKRSEFDLDAGVWVVPADRMKASREHRVPLSDACVALLRPLLAKGEEPFELSNMALLVLLRRMKRDGLTVHGFRSSFKDWAAECTTFENIVSEAALAHVIGDKTEAAYRRGDLFDKRAELMSAWAAFCYEGDNGEKN